MVGISNSECRLPKKALYKSQFSYSTDVPPYQKEKMIFGGGLERFTGNM
jgi:hypothetical protein